MKTFVFSFLIIIFAFTFNEKFIDDTKPDFSKPKQIEGMKLVWNDEFNEDGKPNPAYWRYETGFVRNEELQWYKAENAHCKGGVLLIEGRRVNLPNPDFVAQSNNWKTNRPTINFTSASIQTREHKEWQFGTFIIRAKIDTTLGAWPAIWTLGNSGRWPSNGEIDIMEFYRIKSVPTILGNVAWGTTQQYVAKWDDAKVPLTHFTEKNKNWSKQFHIWRMDWNKDHIKLYLDDELINSTALTETINPDGKNPFLQPHYLLLNLAIGGKNGGQPSETTQLISYEIDYVRVYQ